MRLRISSRFFRARFRVLPVAFTLVEMLVAMTITGLLVGVLIPVLGHSVMEERRAQCLANLRSIGQATHSYINATNRTPAGYLTNPARRWTQLLAPDLGVNETDGINGDVTKSQMRAAAVYRCPNDARWSSTTSLTWDPILNPSLGMNWWMFAANDQSHNFYYGVQFEAIARPASTILFADSDSAAPAMNATSDGFLTMPRASTYYVGTTVKPDKPLTFFSQPVLYVDYRHGDNGFNQLCCDGHASTRTTTTQQDWDASQ